MRYLLVFSLFFAWLITVLDGLLFHVYLWQLKEYRLDRMRDYWRIHRRKLMLAALAWLVAAGLTTVSPPVGVVVIFGLAAHALVQAGKRGVLRPVPTSRALLTLTGSLLVLSALVIAQFIRYKIWWVLLPGGALFTPEMRWLVHFMVADRLAVPLIVAGVLAVTSLPARWAKRRLVRRAAAKVARLQPKNVIGITGSYGKTSTKTFLATLLAAHAPTFQTRGGTNIDVAIARQIVEGLQPEHENMVVEMGAYRDGEIAGICDIVRPNIAIWTAVNEQHLSLFGSLEGTQRAKFELIAALPPDGVAIANRDDPRVMEKMAEWHGRCVTYSTSHPDADVYASDVQVTPDTLRFSVHCEGEQQPFTVNVAGQHNLSNLLAAIAAARQTGMTLAEIAAAGREITPLEGTLYPHEGRKRTLLIDSSYSSNPTGVRAALEYLSLFEGYTKIMLFPGIIELGAESTRIHAELGEQIARVCDLLVLVKDDFAAPLLEGVQRVPDSGIEVLRGLDEAAIFARLEKAAGPNTVILFEGRGTERFMRGLIVKRK